MPRIIVGLGGLLSDPACCVLRDGVIVSALEQSKVSRQDRPGDFPEEALELALSAAQVGHHDIGEIAVARPFAHRSESQAQLALRARFPQSRISVVEHHHAHAASAFFASPFPSASVLSIDRAGDYRSAVLFRGERSRLWPVRELYYPDSLGDLFNRVTELLGYEARADEHKVQWLSTSGEPRWSSAFDSIIGTGPDGWPSFDRSYFDADRLTGGGFSRRFFRSLDVEGETSIPSAARADVAASLQDAVNRAVAVMLQDADAICLAGGVALNSLLVHSLEQRAIPVFVQPAAGNAGTALGAALYAWHNGREDRAPDPLPSLSLGPDYSAAEVKQVVENCKLRFRFMPAEEELLASAVDALNDQKIVAWMQGRMEFGPRALGNRSILASPLNPYSTENLNVYIKHREGSRKFAASVPEELAAEYFEVGQNARYLATVSRVRPQWRERFTAALLGGDFLRVHAVSPKDAPLFHQLLHAAGRATGLPILYNTSFNLFGAPLVCTPRDAVRSFYSSGIDALYAGNFLLEK